MSRERGRITRRDFLKLAGVSGVALAGLGSNRRVVSAAEGDSIRFLAAIDVTGPGANLGDQNRLGFELAVKEINEAGLRGFSSIDYKLVDTETEPSEVKRKFGREVLRWKPDIFGGATVEPTVGASVELAEKHKIPGFCNEHLGVRKYLPPGNVPVTRWYFYYGFSGFDGAQGVGKFLKDQGVRKVGFIGGDYDWGYTCATGLKAFWEDSGKPFEIGPVIYTPMANTDYSTEVEIVKREKPDAIFAEYMGAGFFTWPKQLRDGGAMPPFLVMGAGYEGLGAAQVTGESGAKDIYSYTMVDPGTEEWAGFVKRWKAMYGEKSYPFSFSASAYDTMYWVKEVYEKAGHKDPEGILEVMEKTSFNKVGIGAMGPKGLYGANKGAAVGIMQFKPGATELHPAFGLHEELVAKYDVPDHDLPELIEKVKGVERLLPGKSYPKEG